MRCRTGWLRARPGPAKHSMAALGVCLLAWGVTAAAWGEDLMFSAQVDKTVVTVGNPITLTLTLTGDIAGSQWPDAQFPEGFAVIGRSQSTHFALRAGGIERSVSLIYVLLPQRDGTFQLGPFTVEHGRKTLQTEPVEIAVTQPALSPPAPPGGRRFTL